MKADSSLRFLYDLEMFGIKVGLRNISLLLEATGHPERAFPTIHVAGTNGKGSVSSIMAAVLTAAGLKTGLYTSPHLVDFSERIRINGIRIPRDAIAEYAGNLSPVIRATKATFFEATTAIAFNYFRDAGVDIAVIETGLGGRLDATNVLTPLVSVITNIGFDHTEYLGTTLQAIAREKAGIIKKNIPVVTGEEHADVLAVLHRHARAKNTQVFRAQQSVRTEITKRSLEGLTISLETDRWRLPELNMDLAGDHQTLNVRVAVAALRMLPDRYQRVLKKEAYISGLSSVRRLAGLHGRLELLKTDPRMVLDVAHNFHGILASTTSLRKILPGKWLIVFGVMSDKDYHGMLLTLMKNSRLLIAVRPDTPRALPTRTIVNFLHSKGSKAVDGITVKNGMRMALNERRNGEPLVVIGSHYLAGEALKFLNIAV